MHYHHKNTTFRTRGFTIIELLIVIVIIGILTSITTVTYGTAQRHARDDARKTQINSIATAVETYYAANHRFPGKINGTLNGAQPSGSNAGCELFDNREPNGGAYKYAYTNPATKCNAGNPVISGSYTYTPSDYTPDPTWIPGLAPYLNPFPTEPTYIGGTPVDPLFGATCGATPTFSRTYFYRHLLTGYAVYSSLEAGDASTINCPGSNPYLADEPKITDNPGHTINPEGNVYMIRK